jgi:hypothetical protein
VNHPLQFRPEVPDDIAEACRWYESRSAGLGDTFLRELKSTLTRIALAPEVYGKGEGDVRSARMHKLPYLVHFRFSGAEVLVLAVMFGGRDVSMWQNRM